MHSYTYPIFHSLVCIILIVRLPIASGKIIIAYRLCRSVECKKSHLEKKKRPVFCLENIYIHLIPCARLPLAKYALKSTSEIFNQPTGFAGGCSTNIVVSLYCPKQCQTPGVKEVKISSATRRHSKSIQRMYSPSPPRKRRRTTLYAITITSNCIVLVFFLVFFKGPGI